MTQNRDLVAVMEKGDHYGNKGAIMEIRSA